MSSPQIYMHAVWRGWTIPMLLFLAILRLTLNYLISRLVTFDETDPDKNLNMCCLRLSRSLNQVVILSKLGHKPQIFLAFVCDFDPFVQKINPIMYFFVEDCFWLCSHWGHFYLNPKPWIPSVSWKDFLRTLTSLDSSQTFYHFIAPSWDFDYVCMVS